MKLWSFVMVMTMVGLTACGENVPADLLSRLDLPVLCDRAVVSNGDLSRLHHFVEKARQGGTITFGAIGGSITQTARASKPEYRYVNRIAAWLGTQFPETDVKLVNAGIGGTGSDYGCVRMAYDLLAHNPDLVVIEFSVNDSSRQADSMATYEGVVRQALKTDAAVILLFTMTSKARDTENMANLVIPGTEPVILDGLVRGLNVQYWHSMIGRHYDLPMLSYRDAAWPEIADGRMAWSDLQADLVHPNDSGHELVACLVTDWLGKAIKNCSDEFASPDFKLKAPLVSDRFSRVNYVRAENLTPVENNGWMLDKSGKDPVWVADQPGSEIQFRIKGTGVETVLFQVIGQGGIAELSLDGGPVIRKKCSQPKWALPAVVDQGDELEPDLHTVIIRVAESEVSGPVQVLGIAGTGVGN
jgi:lysophospholipase L1-like esterase